ncbi:MAG TPA: TIGR02444 family protein [Micropepsaceae bacterium]|nr:TIGR02444 family protein [Micropepsaceae bacterium]
MTESTKHRSESPFWRFSLRFYARPHIAEACLVLQDNAGADVNILLFVLYLADHRRQLGAAEIARLDSAVAQWRDAVVRPLRALRRGLKSGVEFIPGPVSETFRSQIKRLELESEQIEQHRLEEFASSIGTLADSRDAAAERNVELYCAKLSNPSRDAIQTILRGFKDFVPIEPPSP